MDLRVRVRVTIISPASLPVLSLVSFNKVASISFHLSIHHPSLSLIFIAFWILTIYYSLIVVFYNMVYLSMYFGLSHFLKTWLCELGEWCEELLHIFTFLHYAITDFFSPHNWILLQKRTFSCYTSKISKVLSFTWFWLDKPFLFDVNEF